MNGKIVRGRFMTIILCAELIAGCSLMPFWSHEETPRERPAVVLLLDLRKLNRDVSGLAVNQDVTMTVDLYLPSGAVLTEKDGERLQSALLARHLSSGEIITPKTNVLSPYGRDDRHQVVITYRPPQVGTWVVDFFGDDIRPVAKYLGLSDPYDFEEPETVLSEHEIGASDRLALLTTGVCPHLTRLETFLLLDGSAELRYELSEAITLGEDESAILSADQWFDDVMNCGPAPEPLQVSFHQIDPKKITAFVPGRWVSCANVLSLSHSASASLAHGFNEALICGAGSWTMTRLVAQQPFATWVSPFSLAVARLSNPL
jgi:hypothetical protein